ncbi:MAG: hypothetical protein RQ752_03030 [Thermohalobaculum sp.]|nr:hypothetical protein [Thermohalobaculum sp.]
MSRLCSILRVGVVLVAVAALGAGCASPRTKAEHRAALDACLRAPDPRISVDCERADILREQMEYERSENASLAVGAFAVSILTLGIISAFDDDDCCYSRGHYGGHYRYN